MRVFIIRLTSSAVDKNCENIDDEVNNREWSLSNDKEYSNDGRGWKRII